MNDIDSYTGYFICYLLYIFQLHANLLKLFWRRVLTNIYIYTNSRAIEPKQL